VSDQAEKVALVTGAASGIGKACAEHLTRDGFLVLRCDLPSEAPDIQPLDVRREADWQAFITQLTTTHGRLDVLVNAAGVSLSGDTIEMCSPEIWSTTFETNVTGPLLGMKSAIPLMRLRGEGVILNIGSIRSNVGEGDAAAYSASKGALGQLSKSVALDLARKTPRIRCNVINPGYISTPLLGPSGGGEGVTAFIARTPLGRLGVPAEVASLVAYLCSDAAAAITGSEFAVDGGYTAQ
jgi:NAD(P)-dependent dehydrogenase (short-subunit alcohol dehydrogenase family)